MAMLERGLEVGEDVDRSIMSKEVRTPVKHLFTMSFLAATLSTYVGFVEVSKGYSFFLFSGPQYRGLKLPELTGLVHLSRLYERAGIRDTRLCPSQKAPPIELYSDKKQEL